MKHLLNNLSEEEKNNIREQYTGGMKLAIDNFNKLVESKSGDAKPYLVEQGQSSQNKKPGFIDNTFNGKVGYSFPGIKDSDTLYKFVTPFDSSQKLFDWLVTPADKGGAGLEDMNLKPESQIQYFNLFGDGLEAVARTGVEGGYATNNEFITQLGTIARKAAPGIHPDKRTYTLDGSEGWKIIGGQETFGRVLSLLVQKAKAGIS